MGGIYDSMNEKLIASEIKEALEMLECATNLSPTSLKAIEEAIDGEAELVLVAVPSEHCFLAGEGRTLRKMFIPNYHLREDEQYYEMYWYKTKRTLWLDDLEPEETGGGE